MKRRHVDDDEQAVEAERRTLAGSLAQLNAQYAAWVSQQARESPGSLWTAAAQDYIKHAEQLLATHAGVLASGAPDQVQGPRWRLSARLAGAAAILLGCCAPGRGRDRS